MAMKLLITAKEASQILGQGGNTAKLIENQTQSRLHLSGKGEYYPGTQLQELTVKGPNVASVSGAVQLAMAKLAEESGRINNDSHDLTEGGASMKFVVPNACAKAIIGRGGENIKLIRDGTGMKVHIESTAIGPQPISEQVVCIQGSLQGMNILLANIFEKLEQECATQPWFSVWAGTSHAGTGGGLPAGQPLLQGPNHTKGSGKGKTKTGAVSGGSPLGGSYIGGGSVANAGGAAAVATPGNMEMVAGALQALPAELAVPGDMSSQISFHVPAATVSALIGKAGAGVQAISGATGTKIQIRELEGSADQKVVIIVGNVVGIISAYCHCMARVFNAPPNHQMPQQQQQQQYGHQELQQQMNVGGLNMGISAIDYSQNPELAAAAAALAEAELHQQQQATMSWPPQ